MIRSTAVSSLLLAATSVFAADRPNVLVVMVDDLGYSDLGCYGGEIDTPHLDALAAGGLQFTQFYNTAKCHSSRVSLLTGQYCMAAGDVRLTNAVTSAEVLREGGYFTAMTGKWHLKQEPTDFGFDRYFGHLSGACNYFSGDNTFRLNGDKWPVPRQGFYTTVADVDHALDFLTEARQESKPWYLYVAFNAPHAPLHALPEDYAKYKGRYDDGWDKVRDARLSKQKRLGVLPEALQPSPRPEHIPAWDSLDEWRQKYESNRMTTLAAMIDRVDQEVGRLVDDLRAHRELENTLFLFVSDNGACPYDRRKPLLDVEPTSAETLFGDSTGWAWARNAPFRYYKQNQFEGGISTPGILHWPEGISEEAGSIVRQPAHLIDVLPTLADVTGCPIPTSWEGRELRPVSGRSLRPLFSGGALERPEPIHFLFSLDRGLRDGEWKLVSFRGEAWELYNVEQDRTELNDLAASEPERLKAMVDVWMNMAKNVLHAPGKSTVPVNQAKLPHRHPEWTNFSAIEPSKGRQAQRRRTTNIRARKNTKMHFENGEMKLTFTGDDPGIAITFAEPLAAGPYRLVFRLQRQATGGGDVFYTTDPRTTLPKGRRIELSFADGPQRQSIDLPLQTDKRLHSLRIDVSDGVGSAVIADLQILSANGEVLWQPDSPTEANSRR